MGWLRNHFWRHGRFYVCVAIGIAVVFATASQKPAVRTLAAADAFFFCYLAFAGYLIFTTTPDVLRRRAEIEDEGILLVIVIALAAVATSCIAIVLVLKEKRELSLTQILLAAAGVPLGWLTFNTIAAFHYADLYYARKEKGKRDSVRGLDFPNTGEPGVWEFLYYSFTVAMTAQTSDTDVLDTKMRRATLGHSIVSFFYYTAIIAMSVNAVVSLAS